MTMTGRIFLDEHHDKISMVMKSRIVLDQHPDNLSMMKKGKKRTAKKYQN